MRTAAEAGQAAALVLRAWGEPDKALSDLPEDLRPANLAHAYAIQQAVSRSLGAVGGWTIETAGAPALLTCTPIPLAAIRRGPTHFAGRQWTLRRVEARICVRIGSSLPDYDAPFGRDRVVAAIESCHAALMVQQPRITDPGALDPLTSLADSHGHACLVYGAHGSPWETVDLAGTQARMLLGEKEVTARTMQPNFDPVETLQWLANEGARWGGGLLVGQLIAFAIGMREIHVPADTPARLVAAGLGEVSVHFAGDVLRALPAAPRPWLHWARLMSIMSRHRPHPSPCPVRHP